jgi:hypothetical protein
MCKLFKFYETLKLKCLIENEVLFLFLISHGLKPKAARELRNEWVGGGGSKGIEELGRFCWDLNVLWRGDFFYSSFPWAEANMAIEESGRFY